MTWIKQNRPGQHSRNPWRPDWLGYDCRMGDWRALATIAALALAAAVVIWLVTYHAGPL